MVNIFESTHRHVCQQDLISESCYTLLHFDGDLKTKNLIGGITSIFIKLYALYGGLFGLVKMFQFQDPYIASIEEALRPDDIGFDGESGKVKLTELSMPFIGFWSADKAVDGKILDTSPYTPKDAFEMRKYIHITLRNKIVTYDEIGNENKTEQTYRLKPCSIYSFKTEYGKDFFKRNAQDKMHCIDDEDLFLQGTRDFQVLKKNHSLMIFEVNKCTKQTWVDIYGPDDPVACETIQNINQWLTENKKRMYIHVLNDKLDF